MHTCGFICDLNFSVVFSYEKELRPTPVYYIAKMCFSANISIFFKLSPYLGDSLHKLNIEPQYKNLLSKQSCVRSTASSSNLISVKEFNLWKFSLIVYQVIPKTNYCLVALEMC